MKTSLVFMDGVCQVALTPESEIDKAVCDVLQKYDQQATLTIKRTQFYKTQGNYIYGHDLHHNDRAPKDILLVITPMTWPADEEKSQ